MFQLSYKPNTPLSISYSQKMSKYGLQKFSLDHFNIHTINIYLHVTKMWTVQTLPLLSTKLPTAMWDFISIPFRIVHLT